MGEPEAARAASRLSARRRHRGPSHRPRHPDAQCGLSAPLRHAAEKSLARYDGLGAAPERRWSVCRSANGDRLEEASLAEAKRLNRPIEYPVSSKADKKAVARRIAERDAIQDGLVCVLRCIEPCASFEVYRNRNAKQLELKSRQRKRMHLYHYQLHPVLGWMNARIPRIQTLFPFSIRICLNGREWLARQLTEARVDYVTEGNCMVLPVVDVRSPPAADSISLLKLAGFAAEFREYRGWRARPVAAHSRLAEAPAKVPVRRFFDPTEHGC